MFSLSSTTRVFLLPGPTDMRKGFEGLRSLAEHRMEQDPLSGHLFVFCNRAKNRLKVLFWDGTGLWVCAKRVETGRVDWPAEGQPIKEQTTHQLSLILNGMVLDEVSEKPWFRRRANAAATPIKRD